MSRSEENITAPKITDGIKPEPAENNVICTLDGHDFEHYRPAVRADRFAWEEGDLIIEMPKKKRSNKKDKEEQQ